MRHGLRISSRVLKKKQEYETAETDSIKPETAAASRNCITKKILKML